MVTKKVRFSIMTLCIDSCELTYLFTYISYVHYHIAQYLLLIAKLILKLLPSFMKSFRPSL